MFFPLPEFPATFLLFLLLQIDKKIVRTEIGVLLRLSHPNIVSKASHKFKALLALQEQIRKSKIHQDD